MTFMYNLAYHFNKCSLKLHAHVSTTERLHLDCFVSCFPVYGPKPLRLRQREFKEARTHFQGLTHFVFDAS